MQPKLGQHSLQTIQCMGFGGQFSQVDDDTLERLFSGLWGMVEGLGIKNIEIIKKDTYNRKNNFFSSRRSKKNNHDYGRNISTIMIK